MATDERKPLRSKKMEIVRQYFESRLENAMTTKHHLNGSPAIFPLPIERYLQGQIDEIEHVIYIVEGTDKEY